MGLKKIIGIFFLIIFLLLAVLGVDLYLTFKGLQDVDPTTLVSNPSYNNLDNETIRVSIDVDLPKAGFIPKGVVITLIVDFDGDVQEDTKNVKFGESDTITLEFTLSTAQSQSLASGSSITVSAESIVTPSYLGFKIGPLEQTIDLGSTTISP